MPEYKTGGSWTAIPTAALWSTYGGTFHVAYPPATARNQAGAPCGAFGLPRILIHAVQMTDAGFAFWRDLFALAGDLSTTLSIEAINPNTGATEKWLGMLLRPRFSRVSWGNSAANTWYHDVDIEITECEATS
jgi:hypothetical protein